MLWFSPAPYPTEKHPLRRTCSREPPAETNVMDMGIEIEMETGTVVLDDIALFQSATNFSPGFLNDDFPTPPSTTYPTFTNAINSAFADDLKYLEFEKSYSIM